MRRARVTTLRFSKCEILRPTSMMLVPVEAKITAIADPYISIRVYTQKSLHDGLADARHAIAPKCQRSMKLTVFRSHRSIIPAFNVQRLTALVLLLGSEV